jgi:hypothetical protein
MLLYREAKLQNHCVLELSGVGILIDKCMAIHTVDGTPSFNTLRR